ncbi:MAG: T9SS type A sorting domain-containing protein [Prolixibacteraceae bacterium]|nr:T9SS type A sorting domain-containing protein [Prolixibacteraceae bacterium]
MYSEQKEVWAGKPFQPYDIWFTPSTPCLDQTVIAQARAYNTALSATTYEWRNISNFTYHSPDYKEVHFTTSSGPLPYGTYVYVKGTNSCGSSSEYSEYLWVDDCGGGVPAAASIVFTPNPTSGETVLSIDSDSKETTLDETTEWDLEIYSETLVMKEKRTGLKGNKYTIQTSGWKEGLYIVHVKYGEEVLTGKLMVKK